jgi:NDP-sugar pyrophosphorylase family protein
MMPINGTPIVVHLIRIYAPWRFRECILAAGLIATVWATVDISELLAYHRNHGGLATITSVPLRSRYGLVLVDNSGRVTRFEEKQVMSWSLGKYLGQNDS